MGIEVDIGSEPEREDLVAEIRWAADAYAVMTLVPEGPRFLIEFFGSPRGRAVAVDAEELEAALKRARHRLLEVYGLV